MKVCCVLIRIASIYRFHIKKEITQNYSKSEAMGFFSKRLQNAEFETAVVNEPSVIEPLKVSCKYALKLTDLQTQSKA